MNETFPIKAMNKMATMNLKYWTWEKLTKNTEGYKYTHELENIPEEEKY